jgi:hypothetical protein
LLVVVAHNFAHAVARINRALTTESYRTGDVEHAGLDEQDVFPADPRTLEHQPVNKRDRPYFEVLVVVSSGDEALIAARLNVNLQAVVIRRGIHGEGHRDVPPDGHTGLQRASPTDDRAGADGLAGAGVQPVELTPGVALDQQWDVVAQRSAVESSVHIVDNAFHGGLRNRGVAIGETLD